MKAVRLGLVVSILTTALAGLYLVVYVYRWEMHRALVAGVLFLAGEIALATTLILRRLESPAARPAVPASEPSAASPPPVPTASERSDRGFRWLEGDRMGVFVPILLGAGTIVSGIAWVVEHLARATVREQDRVVSRGLEDLALPAGGLFASGPVASLRLERAGGPESARRGWRHGRMLGRLAIVLALGVLIAVFLTLALVGRSRPDNPPPGQVSQIVMWVYTRNGLDVDLAARSLWEACHPMVEGQRLVELRRLDSGAHLLVLEPALGDQATRRLHGCLNDGTLDRIHADLRSHTRVAAT